MQAVIDNGSEFATQKQVAEKLGVGKSATHGRIRRALIAGYLENHAKRDERAHKYGVGSALPGSANFLPPPEIVRDVFGELSERETVEATRGFEPSFGDSGDSGDRELDEPDPGPRRTRRVPRIP